MKDEGGRMKGKKIGSRLRVPHFLSRHFLSSHPLLPQPPVARPMPQLRTIAQPYTKSGNNGVGCSLFLVFFSP
jgi:hypothetical protein